tara:strand:+ start:5037 stop:5393 length:357 start_codon:yes stop_codon:yes gene_type:complete
MATIVRRNLNDRIKNDTFSSVQFTIQDGDAVAIDLTGVAIAIKFRYRCKTGSVVKTLAVASGITLTTPLSGIFTIDEFTPITFEVGTYYYDAEITFTDGTIKTYVWGTFDVLQDVTYT